VTDEEIDAKRGTVEIVNRSFGEEVRMWPRFDGEDHVEMVGASTGVILAIRANDTGNDTAVFLTIEELERLLSEGRRLHAQSLAALAARKRPEAS
jgi:hypothetical protein